MMRGYFQNQIQPAKLDEFMAKLRAIIVSSKDVGCRLSWVIADLVENDFGSAERLQYLGAVLQRKAK